jgi:beta-fructofuranosidase
MSLPRVLSLLPDGALGQAPAAELETLRGRHAALPAAPLAPGITPLPAGLPGDRIELLAEVDLGGAASAGLALRMTPDDEERTLVYYDRPGARLVVDRSRASLDGDTARDVREVALALAPGEPLRLRVFVDRSVVEVFANGRTCLASRVYPTRPDARGAALYAEGDGARLLALDGWEMTPVWPVEG